MEIQHASEAFIARQYFDGGLDMRDGLVGFQVVDQGTPKLRTYTRREHSDFLTFVSEFPVGTAKAAGALLLPAINR